MELHHDQIKAAGLKVLAVGLGEPKHARRYCGKLAPSIDCVTYPDDAIHRRYGLSNAGVRSLLDPGMVKATLRAGSRGHVQGKATGNVRMLPGTFIVDREGIIRSAYYSSHAGDHPDLEELLASFAPA